MKIVFLDSAIINPGDISWDGMKSIGEFTAYKRSSREEAVARLSGADAVIVDAFGIDAEIMDACPGLKMISIAATGFNHIDLEAAKARNIAVANVPAYSTDAVAQHAVALMLHLTNKIEEYNRDVQNGRWKQSPDYTFIGEPLTLLAGKSLGIIGYGNIGKKVGEIAEAFGMTVNVYSRNREAAVKSDFVTLHCPLTPENRGMIDEAFIKEMKDGAFLINTARGGLVDENALAKALESGKIQGAGLDVLASEPPGEDCPLTGLDNCYITPHIAFIPVETRRTVVDTCRANISSFIDGGRLNRLV